MDKSSGAPSTNEENPESADERFSSSSQVSDDLSADERVTPHLKRTDIPNKVTSKKKDGRLTPTNNSVFKQTRYDLRVRKN